MPVRQSVYKLIAAGLICLSCAFAWPLPGDAQTGRVSVFILMHEPQGQIMKRLDKAASQAATIPPELRDAAAQEIEILQLAQKQALTRRLVALGGENVQYYGALNTLRADIPPAALDSLQADPAVAAVFPAAIQAETARQRTPVIQSAPASAGNATYSPMPMQGLDSAPAAGQTNGNPGMAKPSGGFKSVLGEIVGNALAGAIAGKTATPVK